MHAIIPESLSSIFNQWYYSRPALMSVSYKLSEHLDEFIDSQLIFPYTTDSL